MAGSTRSQKVYLSAASYSPASPRAAEQPKGQGGRRPMVPGSFVVLVVE